MQYQPIRRKKIYEEIADVLIDMIKTGRLNPGDQLSSVEQLAENFQVSRSTIREALSGLRAIGLVEMRQGEGTYVSQFQATHFSMPAALALIMKREDMKELSEVRKILEVGSAGLAALNHTEKDIQLMKTAIQEMKDAKGKREVGEKADFSFHMAIVNASNNKMLIQLMTNVSDIMMESMRETRRLILYSDDHLDKLLNEHEDILQAIQVRNSEKAQQTMRNHLEEVDRIIEKYVN